MAVTQAKNATVSNPVEAALNAFKAGADPEAAVYGGAPAPSPSNNPQLLPEDSSGDDSAQEQNTEQTQDESADGDAGAESQEASGQEKENAQGAQSKSADVESIFVTDDSGRREIKIDFSDRAKIKKAYELAALARKMQAERDRLSSRVKEIEPQHGELQQSWSAIEKAVQEGGLKGLVNLVSGDANAFDSLIEKEMALRDWKKNATPSEIERYEAQEQAAQERRNREKLEKEFQNLRDTVANERETAVQKALESKVNPAFDKWRFAGKLKDPALEEMLDKSIWTTALDNLDAARQKLGIAEQDMPASMIEQEFRKVRASFDKVIAKRTEEKTSQIIQQKKAAAQEKVAAHATKGMAKQSGADQFTQAIRSGNFVDAFRTAMGGK